MPARCLSSSVWSSLRTPHSSTVDDGIVAVGAVQRERLAQVLAEQLALLEAGQLEDALADGQDARVAIAGQHARVRAGVEVVEQLEDEAEAAARAADGLMREAVTAVGVHRAQAAIGADEVRHRLEALRARQPVGFPFATGA